jgi:hypothetical protein
VSWFSWFWPRRRAPQGQTRPAYGLEEVGPSPLPGPQALAADPAVYGEASILPPAPPVPVPPPPLPESMPVSTVRAPAPFPRFGSTASDQIASRDADRAAQARLKLRNVYTPAQPISDRRMFAGRTEVLAALIRAIENQRLHVIVYGERGIGKTSLLHVLAEAAREARYSTVYVSCGAGQTFDEMFRAVAAEIPLLFHGDFGPTSLEVQRGQTLASLLTAEPVSPRAASDMLARLVDTRVLVLLDEFDRCEQGEFRLNVAELIKDLSDRSVRVQLVIAGVAANLTELIAHIPSIQRNIFALHAPRMTDVEITELVRGGESVANLHFDEAAIDFILTAANGFPYLASLLSHHAATAALDEGRFVIATDDVSSAIAAVLNEFNGRISRRSQLQISACVHEQLHKLLGPLAGAGQLTGGRFTEAEVRALNPDEAGKHQELLESLAADGVLIEASTDELGRSYRFLDGSTSIYLWLLWVQDRFTEARRAQPPAVSRTAPSDAESAGQTRRDRGIQPGNLGGTRS